MKLSEIRNKMFGLSDLKGLIKENTFDEVMSEDGKWQKFFSEHPEYLEPEYDYLSDKTVGSRLWTDDDFWKKVVDSGIKLKQAPTREYLASLDKQGKKNLGGGLAYARNAELGKIQRRLKLSDQEVIARQIDGTIPTQTISKTPYQHLLDFYNYHNQGLECPEAVFDDVKVLYSYLYRISTLADKATEFYGTSFPGFSPNETMVGDITNPFSMFLLLYYFKNAENFIGTGKPDKRSIYINNVDVRVREYVKNFVGFTPNVFDTINRCNGNKLKNIRNTLELEGFGGEELAKTRSLAYYEKYIDVFNGQLTEQFVNEISEEFNYPAQLLFDPLSTMSDGNLILGFQHFCIKQSGKMNGSVSPGSLLNILKKPTFVSGAKDGAPIENIFIMARTIGELLDVDYGAGTKFGASGKNVLGGSPIEKIKVLFAPANDGVKMLEQDAERRGIKMPKHIVDIRTMCNSRLVHENELKFWNLLVRDSGTKTQDDIFYFLSSVSDPDVQWETEYNRFNKGVDLERNKDGLGDKSIDIMGTKELFDNTKKKVGEVKLCFEYQGEGHYRPFCIRKSDEAYTLFTQMRDDILEECGFVAKMGTNGTKYYSGIENLPEEFIKETIISVFKRYADLLEAAITQKSVVAGDVIGPGVNIPVQSQTVVTEASKVGRNLGLDRLKKYTINEAYEYFREVASIGLGNDSLFKASTLNGNIPYLCSPVRFMDEVATAEGRERDLVKSAIIKKRESEGWKMAYITPKVSSSFTEEDLKYTEEIVCNGGRVFQWNDEGKNALVQYLVENGFKTVQENAAEGEDTINENKSLFEEIVREVFNDDFPL